MSAAPVAPPPVVPSAVRAARLRLLPPTPDDVPARPPSARADRAGRPPTGAPRYAGLAPSTPAQAWRRRATAALALGSLVVVVVAGLLALVGSPAADAPPLVPAASASVVVEPGESLWDVARAHAPATTSTGAYVETLRVHNGLAGSTVQAWQVLQLPPLP